MSSVETNLKNNTFKDFSTYALPTLQGFSNLTQGSIRYLSPLLHHLLLSKLVIGVTCHVSLPDSKTWIRGNILLHSAFLLLWFCANYLKSEVINELMWCSVQWVSFVVALKICAESPQVCWLWTSYLSVIFFPALFIPNTGLLCQQIWSCRFPRVFEPWIEGCWKGWNQNYFSLPLPCRYRNV